LDFDMGARHNGSATPGQDALAQAKQIFAANERERLGDAIALLEEAARAGNGEATAQLAHFIAAGVSQKPDWDLALDKLALAAGLGWVRAGDELRLLAQGRGDSIETVRAAIDIRALIAPRRTETVSASPRIRTIAGFMSGAECRWMIEASAARLSHAKVYDDARVGSQIVSTRSNRAANFVLPHVDIVLVLLHARISNTIGLPSACFEPTSVLHYAPGQEFSEHVDYLDPDVPGQANEILLRGQRLATFLVYLNRAYTGGETDFPRVPYRHKGETGDALVFASVDPTLVPDARTRHAGLPPTSGEKWLLSQWIRNKPVS